MRQLIVTGGFPLGVHTFVTREVAATRAAGHEVAVLAAGPGDEAGAAQARVLGVADITSLRASYGASALYGGGLRWLSPRVGNAAEASVYGRVLGARRRTFFASLLRRPEVRGVDLVHAHFVGWGFEVALPLGELLGVPVTVTAHNSELGRKPLRVLAGLQQRAAAIVLVSAWQQRVWADLTGSAERLVVVRNGVDVNEYPTDLPGQRGPGGLGLVAIGRLVPDKRVGDVIEAAALCAGAGEPLRLVILGDGPERRALEARARALGLGGQVAFHGLVSHAEVRAELARADLLVHASAEESFGMAVAEAMAARLPVIAARSAGVADVVEEGVSGWLYAPGDVEELARRLLQLARDPAERARLGQAGRARVEARYSWQAHMAGMLAVWQQALECGRGVVPGCPDIPVRAGSPGWPR